VLVRDIDDCTNIKRIQARIADGFREHGFRTLVESGAQVLRMAAVKETGRNADLGQRVVEQVIGASIQAGRGGDLVSGVGDIEDRQRLGRLPRRRCQRAYAASRAAMRRSKASWVGFMMRV